MLYTLYSIVRRFQPSLNTSMSVEFSEQTGKDYGPIRMMGAVGYCVMMYIVALIADSREGVERTFYVYTLLCAVNIALVCLLPPMKGHNRRNEGRHVSPLIILKNKPIVTLIVFQMLMSVSNSLFHTFFSIYFTEDMGGSNTLYGTMLSVSAFIEIPFLFLADRILKRLGAKWTLFTLGMLTTVRWGATYFARSTGVLFAVQCGNFVNILYGVVVALMLNRMVAPQLKTTVQSIAIAIQSVVSILISSYLGGYLSDLIGIRPLYLYAAIIALVTTVVFCLFIFKFDDTDKQPHLSEEATA